jgi:hypothetical protein
MEVEFGANCYALRLRDRERFNLPGDVVREWEFGMKGTLTR